jgi:hypothetical protein
MQHMNQSKLSTEKTACGIVTYLNFICSMDISISVYISHHNTDHYNLPTYGFCYRLTNNFY